MKSDNSYKEGLKFTSIFGGVQFFQSFIYIVKSKIVAVLLGPDGIGIIGLLNSLIQLILTICNVGITQTAVRNLSLANSSGDKQAFNKAASVFFRLIRLTAVIGMLLCLLLSPLWSYLTFGNFNYTIAFLVLSCSVLMNQMSNGNNVLMQSTRKMKMLATSAIYGSIVSLVISVPLYFFLHNDGIVPAIAITSIAVFLISRHYARKIKYEKVPVTNKVAIKEGRNIIRLGFFVTLQGFFSMLTTYLICIFVNHIGSTFDVGIYRSGFMIVDTAVSMVFAAISSEYYPRLSACSRDVNAFNNAINQQMHISLVFLGPILALFTMFSELVVFIFLSPKFLLASTMMQIAMFGAFLRGPALCLGYTFLAKGDTKAFWLNEFTSKLFELIVTLLCYYKWGINGLGVAYFITYIEYLLQSAIICKHRYNYSFDTKLLYLLIPQMLIGIAIFVIVRTLGGVYMYSAGSLLCIVSIALVFKALRKKLLTPNTHHPSSDNTPLK